MKNLPANFTDNHKTDYFYEKSIAITNKANNGTVNDGKSNGKSLVDMIKNEKNSGFGFNIDERINRILSKNKEKYIFLLIKLI